MDDEATIDPFVEIEKPIGYKSFIVEANAIRLVKELIPDRVTQDSVQRWFTAAKALQFPAIPRVFRAIFEEDQIPLIVYEFVPGDPLASFISHKLRLTDCQMLIVAYGLARSLQYITEMEVRHCEVTTHNVILNKNLEPFLCDFGFLRYKPELWLSRGPRIRPFLPKQYRQKLGPFSSLANGFVVNAYGYGVVLNAMVTMEEPQEDMKAVSGHFLSDIIGKCLTVTDANAKTVWPDVIRKLEELGSFYADFVKYKLRLNEKVAAHKWPEEGALENLEDGMPVDLSPKLCWLLQKAFAKSGNEKVSELYKKFGRIAWNS